MNINLKWEIEKYLVNHPSINILISGVSCSGKTTLANELEEYFSEKCKVSIIHQDDYFKDLKDIPRADGWRLLDSIDAFHVNEFRYDVFCLLKNGFVYMPEYDVASNMRISKDKPVGVGRVNIFEGLHTIRVLDGLDNCMKIFVDTEMRVCLNRRITRDIMKYGVSRDRIITYWNSCIVPMSFKYVLPQKDEATFIINRG